MRAADRSSLIFHGDISYRSYRGGAWGALNKAAYAGGQVGGEKPSGINISVAARRRDAQHHIVLVVINSARDAPAAAGSSRKMSRHRA